MRTGACGTAGGRSTLGLGAGGSSSRLVDATVRDLVAVGFFVGSGLVRAAVLLGASGSVGAGGVTLTGGGEAGC